MRRWITFVLFALLLSFVAGLASPGPATAGHRVRHTDLTATARPGDLDATFGADGIQVTPVSPGHDRIAAVALQVDQRIVAAGSGDVTGSSRFALARYSSSGMLDPAFGDEGIVLTDIAGQANGVAIQPDGALVAAGGSDPAVGEDVVIARFLADGSPDPSFGEGGVSQSGYGGGADSAADVVVQPDGAILIAGSAVVRGQTRSLVARYLSNGELDPAFGRQGSVLLPAGAAVAVALQSDGKIVVLGTNAGRPEEYVVARLLPDGGKDLTFGTNGFARTPIGTQEARPSDVIVDPDGKILAGGSAIMPTTANDFVLIRYLADGSLDPAFGAGGVATADLQSEDDVAADLALDGAWIYLAGSNVDAPNHSFVVARFDSAGALDPAFGNGGWTETLVQWQSYAEAMVVQADGNVVLGGRSMPNAGSDDFTVARYVGGAFVPTPRREADFNGDGFADLAVGVPTDDPNGVTDAGAVNVLYGSSSGLTSTGNQLWTQDSAGVDDVAEFGDEFGNGVAAGDFDGDGYADLAVGVPAEDTPVLDAGAVNVIYGSAAGLATDRQQFWTQDSPDVEDVAEPQDFLAFSLSTGDFNGDGFFDLAIPVPLEDVGSFADGGAVNVLYGSIDGLTAVGDQLWHQDVPGIEDSAEPCDPFGELCDAFGSSLGAGDFDADGYADLAVGVSGEDIGPVDAGAVSVIHGSPSGLAADGDQFWSQDSPDIGDSAEPGDLFGARVAAGDLNGDGAADMVVGIDWEDVGSNVDAGAIQVIYGSPAGLAAVGDQYWNQNSGGILDSAEPCDPFVQFCDQFGFALTIGDFDGDGFGDVAVGVTGEDLAFEDMGATHVIYGTASGLTSAGNQLWSQDSPDIKDNGEGGDALGWELTAGDFGSGDQIDLVLGSPWENIGSTFNGGAINVLYGGASGIGATGNQYWNQNSTGILDAAGQDDFFAWGLSSGPAGSETAASRSEPRRPTES